MKKYLLVALLAMGATAFGAVTENSPSEVSLPVRAKGEIIDAGTQLMIEAVTSGVSADVMEFNFGSIVKPAAAATPAVIRKAAEPGKFIISRGDGSALLDGATYDKMTVGIGKNATTATTESKDNPAGQGIKVAYVLQGDGSDVTNGALSYVGYVNANIEVTGDSEGAQDGAIIGSFTESANRVYVKVSKQ